VPRAGDQIEPAAISTAVRGAFETAEDEAPEQAGPRGQEWSRYDGAIDADVR